SVPARRKYAETARSFLPDPNAPPSPAPQQADDVLDLADVVHRHAVETRLMGNVLVHEPNRLAALEVMSRLAAYPRWLVSLPPSMSPPESSKRPGLLEHPAEAFDYFRNNQTAVVVCQ